MNGCKLSSTLRSFIFALCFFLFASRLFLQFRFIVHRGDNADALTLDDLNRRCLYACPSTKKFVQFRLYKFIGDRFAWTEFVSERPFAEAKKARCCSTESGLLFASICAQM